MIALIHHNEANCYNLFRHIVGINRDLEVLERRWIQLEFTGKMPEGLLNRLKNVQGRLVKTPAGCRFAQSIQEGVKSLSNRMARVQLLYRHCSIPYSGLEIDPEDLIDRTIKESGHHPFLAVVLQCSPEADPRRVFSPWSPSLLAMYKNLARAFHVYRVVMDNNNLKVPLEAAKSRFGKKIKTVIIIGHGSDAGVIFGTGQKGTYGKGQPHREIFSSVERGGELVILSCCMDKLGLQISRDTHLIVSASVEKFEVAGSHVDVVQGKVQAYHLGFNTNTPSTRKFFRGVLQPLPCEAQVIGDMSQKAQEGDVGAAHFCRTYFLRSGNSQTARMWSIVAAKGGDPFSVGNLGFELLDSGNERGEVLLKRAAKRGEPTALAHLGRYYFNSRLYDEAFPILLKAAKRKSDPRTHRILSQMYAHGLGTRTSPALARFHIEKGQACQLLQGP